MSQLMTYIFIPIILQNKHFPVKKSKTWFFIKNKIGLLWCSRLLVCVCVCISLIQIVFSAFIRPRTVIILSFVFALRFRSAKLSHFKAFSFLSIVNQMCSMCVISSDIYQWLCAKFYLFSFLCHKCPIVIQLHFSWNLEFRLILLVHIILSSTRARKLSLYKWF